MLSFGWSKQVRLVCKMNKNSSLVCFSLSLLWFYIDWDVFFIICRDFQGTLKKILSLAHQDQCGFSKERS